MNFFIGRCLLWVLILYADTLAVLGVYYNIRTLLNSPFNAVTENRVVNETEDKKIPNI